MRVEYDQGDDMLYIQIYEWMPGDSPERGEGAETFILADGINVDVNEEGEVLGLEVEGTEFLKEWLEAPIRHRLKLDSRIRRS